MRRRAWVWGLLLLVCAVAAVGGVVGLLLKQEPDFYTSPAVNARRPDDPQVASGVQTRLTDLKFDEVNKQPEWGVKLSQDELNAFFREDPAMNNLMEPLLGGLTAPRVAVEGDRVRFAARYGKGVWSTVVSVELRAWVVADEPNLFAVEVVSMRCGVLPVSKRLLMEKLNEFAPDNAASVNWFRNGDNPVAVFRWKPNDTRPSTLLQTITVADGHIGIAGRNLNPE